MGSIRALGKFLKPYKGIALLGPLLMVLEVTMDLLQPAIMQNIIDHGIANQDRDYVIGMGLLMIVAALIGLAGGLGCIFFSTKTAVNFSGDIRLALFRKIMNFSGENRERFGAGKLITIVTNDIVTIQTALTMTLRVLVRGPLLFLGSMVIVLLSSNGLFPVLFVVVPVLLCTVFFIVNRSSRMFRKVQEAMDKVNTKLQENLAGMRVIKAYVQQKQEIQRFAEVNDGWTKANRSAVQVISIMMPTIMLVIHGGIIGTLWLGSYKVANNSIEVGAILAFINYLMLMLMSLMSVSMVSIMISRAAPSAARIQEVLDTETTIADTDASYEPEEVRGQIEFRDVSFSYSKNEEQVIKHISFFVQSGETVGIIGSTGSGKSTLVKLIERLYEVDSGEILLDGINIKHYKLSALRASIGFVTQKATLFSGSILENIRYGDDSADVSDIRAAAATAQASEFIDRLEQKYAYTLTQGAANLSGGQKQRLSLARAFVRTAPILVLDDSTSAVDAKFEEKIQSALRKYSDQTVFFISSKISSLIDADKILVLEDGELVGLGNHYELLDTCEVYREIYLSQGGQLGSLTEIGGKG